MELKKIPQELEGTYIVSLYSVKNSLSHEDRARTLLILYEKDGIKAKEVLDKIENLQSKVQINELLDMIRECGVEFSVVTLPFIEAIIWDQTPDDVKKAADEAAKREVKEKKIVEEALKKIAGTKPTPPNAESPLQTSGQTHGHPDGRIILRLRHTLIQLVQRILP